MRFALYIFLILPLQAFCQTLIDGSRITINVPTGEVLTLYSAEGCDHCYYYLPSSLRISAATGTPEISFVVWNDEETSKPVGGIFHFLVEWGILTGSERDLQKTLRTVHDSLAVIMGPAIVYPQDTGGIIVGNDKLSAILTASLKNIPSLPTTPGAKMALSFRFTEKEINDFLFYVKNPDKAKSNLKITYRYTVKTVSGQERFYSTILRLPFSQILKAIK